MFVNGKKQVKLLEYIKEHYTIGKKKEKLKL